MLQRTRTNLLLYEKGNEKGGQERTSWGHTVPIKGQGVPQTDLQINNKLRKIKNVKGPAWGQLSGPYVTSRRKGRSKKAAGLNPG